MEDLTTITKAEANKLVLNKIKGKVMNSVSFQMIGLGGLSSIVIHDNTALKVAGGIALLGGIMSSISNARDSYGIAKEYLINPEKYIQDNYQKTIAYK